jgi:poly(3-hydroxybutyrate) depolymerase
MLLLACAVSGQNLDSSTNLDITKAWSQEPAGFTYTVDIAVPLDAPPVDGYPVCILLHGNGGTGGQMVMQFSSILECHVLVAPTGYLNSWNICAESSDGPDIEMVNELIDSLQTYSNVNRNKIRILGFSNGAGLANSVFIENTNPGLDMVGAVVSHLNEPQYHLGNFYKIATATEPASPFCGYNTVATPVSGRRYLNISNDNDPLIPYGGGLSMVGVPFVSAQDAAFAIAKSQGYTGTMLTGSGTPIGTPIVWEYSYLSGDVVHIQGDAFHGLNSTQEEYIKSFFEDCGDPALSCSTDLAPANPRHTYSSSSVTLEWDVINQSEACQISATRLSPPGPSPTLNLIGSEIVSRNVSYSLAGAGSEWEWKVRCACNLSPVEATPFSVRDTFTVPLVRSGVLDVKQSLAFPNPARASVRVSAFGQYETVTITNLSGRVIYQGRVTDSYAEFDVRAWSAGVYLVTLEGESGKLTEQLVVE